MFSPGNLPRGLPEVEDCGGARRDQELDGETQGTQFRQVRAAMCVIPYVLYALYHLIDDVCLCVCICLELRMFWRGPCLALYAREARLQVGIGVGVLVEYG